MLVTIKSAVPALVNVAVIAALGFLNTTLPKFRLSGEIFPFADPTVVPARVTVCGLVPSVSVIVTWPEYGVRDCGVKVTLMVQLLPAASEAPHVFDSAKKLLKDAIELIPNAETPVLVSVTVCAGLVVPT